MSDKHKAALAQGREEGRAVRHYLEALRNNRPKRGRKRTPDTIERRLAVIEAELAEADPIQELKLVQERLNLQAELQTFGAVVDIATVESDFVAVAKGYSDRNGVTYAAWRQVGVEPSVLRRAGIAR